MRAQIISAIFLLLSLVNGFTVSYRNHRVVRTKPENLEQIHWLYDITKLNLTYADFDFWKAPSRLGRAVDLRLSESVFTTVTSYINQGGLQYSILIDDLQQHFEEARVQSGDGTWDTAYHSFDDITAWLKQAASQNPSFVKLVEIGSTYENRTFYGVQITTSTNIANTPQIYLDGGIHAREWIAPAVVEYLIGQFVNHSATNATIANYINKFVWTLVPVWNADGYVYTWTTDPNWRKNRQPNSIPCVGTDLCRNADAGFGGPGSSADPCSDTYHGASAWSAPETAVFRDYISKVPNLKGYTNFHSYDESWLTNYGYTDKLPADYTAQEADAKKVTDAIKSVNGEQYAYGPAYSTIYPASGIPSDWTYDTLKVLYSQACELRGNSFQPPPSLIVPNGAEILAGVLALADSIAAL